MHCCFNVQLINKWPKELTLVKQDKNAGKGSLGYAQEAVAYKLAEVTDLPRST